MLKFSYAFSASYNPGSSYFVSQRLPAPKVALPLQSQTATGRLVSGKNTRLPAERTVTELSGRPACLTRRAARQGQGKRNFSLALAKVKAVFVPLHPVSTGDGQTEKRERKKHKIFSLRSWKVKNSSYLCTPNRRKGLQAARKGLVKRPTTLLQLEVTDVL